jgi:hypothetical protein
MNRELTGPLLLAHRFSWRRRAAVSRFLRAGDFSIPIGPKPFVFAPRLDTLCSLRLLPDQLPLTHD